MKIKHIAILSLSTIVLALSSCGEDFLLKNPQGSIDQTALTNPQGVELLVTNAYANLTENDWGASIFNWALSGMYGGDANKGSESGDQSVLNEMEIYATMSTNGYLNEKWNWVYKGSKRVNMALQVMADVEDMDEGLKTIRRGELLFLRAMFYFEGVRAFGPYIPYIDDSYTENDPKVHNDKDIYPNIIADIDVAIASLPDKPSEVGRIYSWAAKGLKAKILAQRGDLAAAKPILADLLTNGVTATGKKYALADNMDDNWSALKDNTSPESIWEIQFSADGPNNNGNPGMSLCYPHNSGPGGCCGFYQPSHELANSYQVDENGLPYLNGEYRSRPSHTVINPAEPPEDGEGFYPFLLIDPSIAVDPRLDFAIGRWGIPYKDYGLPGTDWVRKYIDGGIFLPKKHVFSQAEADAGLGRANMYDGWAPGSAMNIQYLSVRDAMLLYAECLANDGELSAAMDLVNQVRTRAAREENTVAVANNGYEYKEKGETKESDPIVINYKIATYPATHAAFSNKETCIKAVRMERKLELAMEGQRFFDLSRWGGDYMAAELAAYVDYEKKHLSKFAGAAYLPASKTMFPVPQNQIDLMGNDESGQPYLVQPDPWK